MEQCRQCGQAHDVYAACTLTLRAGGRPLFAPDDEALVGNVVAERYHVDDVLGQGTTGTVFAVKHLNFGRPAAMKVLRPRYVDENLIPRVFDGDARAAWGLTHPGLCEVFDVGTLPDGAPFFVMERLHGETLATRITRDRLSLGSAVDVIMQVLSAMTAIHARDLLIRDLRPQNVFLAHRRGCRPLLKILDFGLARLNSLERIQAHWHEPHGPSPAARAVPYYLSPERTRGEHGVEPASDLFVAAVIFYEALAGEPPFSGSSFERVLLQIGQAKPVPLHERRADVSPDLSAFVSRALSASPRARPASAKEMQDELRSIFECGRNKGSAPMYAAVAHVPNPFNNSGGEESTFASIAAPPPLLATPPRPRDASRPDAATVPRNPSRSNSASVEHALSKRSDDGEGYEASETRREAGVRAVLASLSAVGGDAFPDEASAESADRTVPPSTANVAGLRDSGGGEPPAGLDDVSDKTMEVRRQDSSKEDEETETMKLTPELRARVKQLLEEQMAPEQPAPESNQRAPVSGSASPPPTRPLQRPKPQR